MSRLIRDPTFVLAALLALAGPARLWQLGERSPGIDYYQFWVAAQVREQDATRLYDAPAQREIAAAFGRRAASAPDSPRLHAAAQARSRLELFGTPFLYTVFRVIVTGDYEVDYRRYRMLSLGAFVAAILILGRLLHYPPQAAAVLLGFLAFAFQPLRADIRVGNVNQIQLLWLATYLWLGTRARTGAGQLTAGGTLGLSIAFKPNVVAVVPLLAAAWLLAGRMRPLLLQGTGLLVGTAVALGASAIRFGSVQIWEEWAHALRALPAPIIPVGRGNFAIARLVHEHAGPSMVPVLVATTLVASLGALWIHRTRRRPDASPADAVLLVGTGCLVFLLSAPLVWQHYLVLTLPTLMVLLGPLPTPAASPVAVLLTVAALAAIAINPYADLLGLTSLTYQAVAVNGGLVLLFGISIGRLTSGP